MLFHKFQKAEIIKIYHQELEILENLMKLGLDITVKDHLKP